MSHIQAIKHSKILIVDDDRVIRSFLRALLENDGFTNITEAADGQQAWEKTLELLPDMVFLDMSMQVMDGFEYCRLARENPSFSKMVILAQSGLTDVEEKRRIFASGVTDYVSKPLDLHEIMARVYIHLNNVHYLKELEDFSNRVKQELQSAKRLVDISLPNEPLIQDIKQHYGIDVFSFFQSSTEMGGDFWNLHAIDDTRIGIYVVDFSGHGVDSALNATRLDCLIKSSPDKAGNPGGLMEWLNSNLFSLLPPEQYATMFYGVIDIKTNLLTYATAASPEMFVMRKYSAVEVLSGEGYPLGSVEAVEYENRTVAFNNEDVLMIYSDAIIETEDKDGNFLSDVPARFEMEHKGDQTVNLREWFDMFIYHFVSDYGDNLSDDLTIVMCSRAATN